MVWMVEKTSWDEGRKTRTAVKIEDKSKYVKVQILLNPSKESRQIIDQD